MDAVDRNSARRARLERMNQRAECEAVRKFARAWLHDHCNITQTGNMLLTTQDCQILQGSFTRTHVAVLVVRGIVELNSVAINEMGLSVKEVECEILRSI